MKFPAIRGKNLILAVTVPLVVIADQVTKALAVAYLKPLSFEANPADRFVTVIDGFWRFKFAENTGAAWGLFRNTSAGFRVPFFIIVSLLAIVFIVWFFRRLEPKQKLLPLAVSLVLGGALGNLIDRALAGKVVDFIDWFITFDSPVNFGLFTVEAGQKHWPTFNVADAAISVGVVLLVIEMFVGKKKEPGEEAEPEGQDGS
jgi:signal peptidase II